MDSVDSLRLAQRLNEAAEKLGKRLPVLIEVKLSPGRDEGRARAGVGGCCAIAGGLPDLDHLETRGLMTIAPWGAPEDVTRACFRSLREWRDRWAAAYSRLNLDVLSMGMSGDFPLAIAEGATRIRVGTALFGKRAPDLGPPDELGNAARSGGRCHAGGSRAPGREKDRRLLACTVKANGAVEDCRAGSAGGRTRE